MISKIFVTFREKKFFQKNLEKINRMLWKPKLSSFFEET